MDIKSIKMLGGIGAILLLCGVVTYIGEYFNLDLFTLAGNFLFWGAISLIILVGLILVVISDILLAVAFFSLPDKEKIPNTNA